MGSTEASSGGRGGVLMDVSPGCMVLPSLHITVSHVAPGKKKVLGFALISFAHQTLEVFYLYYCWVTEL